METRRYRLLGGLEVIADGARLELGTRKQRALLALLLLAEGQVVTGDRLIEGLWGEEPPERAEASVQSYVSVLRRTLEPDRAPRSPATVLVTRGTGYALLAPRAEVDAWRFADVVEQARTHHAEGDVRAAATELRNALAMYAPLLPEFDDDPFREEAAQHLERIHLAALELSYEVRLGLGEHRMLVADLENAVKRHPLHEGLWALLAIARYRMGRQSDALKAVADARRLLSEEIGVDPGPRLRQLEADLLAQAPHLDLVLPPEPRPAAPAPASPAPVSSLVGRADELALLDEAVLRAAGGDDALVIVEGDPGLGKTALLEEATVRAADRHGVRTYWGRCVDGDGSPAMWPWVQVLTQVLHELDDAERTRLLDTELGRLVTAGREVKPVPTTLPDAGERFRLFDQAGELLDEVASRRPIMVVMDDLQWADQASLMLFTHMARRRPVNAVLAGAMRPQTGTTSRDLAGALAAISRLPGHRRIRLGPLAAQEVGELIRQETGGAPAQDVIGGMVARTDGNPFFVRELSRLLRGRLDADSLGSAGVPSGVRDVVRGRLEGVGAPSTEVLQLAAVIGRQVDLGLLARAADVDVEQCLERLEPAEALGLLTPTPDDPFSFRFAHDLVRESIVETIPPLRLGRLHLRIADALEAAGRDAEVVDSLAHHLWSAGPLSPPERTAKALVGAGRRALRTYAYDDAERHLRAAARLARNAGAAELELSAVALLTSVIGVRQGDVGAELELMERAEQLAGDLGRTRQAGDFLFSRWRAYAQRVQLDPGGRLAAQLREHGEASDDPVLRVYGDHAWAVDRWDRGRFGEAYRAALGSGAAAQEDLRRPGVEEGLRPDLQLLAPALLGYLTTVHLGDVGAGRRILDDLERALPLGPYPVVVWAAFSGAAAAMAGVAPWAAQAGQRAIDADPHLTFHFLGTCARIPYWWAQAMLGRADEAVDEIRSLLKGLPGEAPRSGEAFWQTLLAEALLAAARPAEAQEALALAGEFMDRHDQRYAEPLTLLVHARARQAAGGPDAEIDALLAEARHVAAEGESRLMLGRIDAFGASRT